MKKKHASLIIVLVILMLVACEKENRNSKYLYFPAGRSFLKKSNITVTVNDSLFSNEYLYDDCGGYWLKIDKKKLPESGSVCIQYTRKSNELSSFYEENVDPKYWLKESKYIDCNNEVIRAKAQEIAANYTLDFEKAVHIMLFVNSHMKLQIYENSFLEKASDSYKLGYGTCINFSRLNIALCRAAGIPARSIWGVVYGYNNDNIYDYHHQWQEILDENGEWTQFDLTYNHTLNLNDVRYLDLLYGAEENTFIRNNEDGEIVLGDVEYFDGFPAPLSGRLGFELVSDNRPDSMTVRYIYTF